MIGTNYLRMSRLIKKQEAGNAQCSLRPKTEPPAARRPPPAENVGGVSLRRWSVRSTPAFSFMKETGSVSGARKGARLPAIEGIDGNTSRLLRAR